MTPKTSPSLFLRISLCLLILAAGGAGFIVLKKMKKPPQMVEAQERALPVQVVQVQPEQVDVVISGYGEVRSRTVVPLSAEVTGRITSVHENLQVGLVVPKGEILCRINEQDYRLEFDTATARLKNLKRDLELARKELARVRDLYKKNRVGTLSSVEKSEQTVNGIMNQRVQVQQAMEMAKLRLERCVIRAPFTCRITELNVEQDEYVTPGRKLFTIVDDGDLEVLLSLDSRDAVNWLRFQPDRDRNAWFSLPEETDCTVRWTENDMVQGTGRLDRVVRFDPRTRTLVVAVRLKQKTGASFPLVQGMFCRVDIQGRPLAGVFVLPRRAVDFEGRVYVVEKNRLHSRRVQVAKVQDNKALVGKGLQPGEIVITTRLESPLENTLVQVEQAGEPGQ